MTISDLLRIRLKSRRTIELRICHALHNLMDDYCIVKVRSLDMHTSLDVVSRIGLKLEDIGCLKTRVRLRSISALGYGRKSHLERRAPTEEDVT